MLNMKVDLTASQGVVAINDSNPACELIAKVD